MALKKPSELFGKKVDNPKISENINGNLNNIKQQFDKVEELKKELEGVTNSIDNSLSKVVDNADNSVNFVEFKEEYSELVDNLNVKIEGIKEDFDNKIDELRAAHLTLNTEITILDKRQNNLHIRGLKDEVIEELQNILNGNVYQNIRSLEEKFDSINEKQLQTLSESYNEPPNVDNSDPLTPLDKKYVTLDEFQEQYRLFINRIQKQLATFGGGGAVRIQDMDDVDLSTAKVNDKFLKYNSTSGKWEGADASGGGGGGGSGITTAFINAQTLNVAGVSTFTGASVFAGNIDANESLDVDGHTELDTLNVSGISTFAADVNLNGTTRFGGNHTISASSDSAPFDIRHSGPNGIVSLGGSFVGFYNAAGTEYGVLSIADAGVELAFNNQLRLETNQAGVVIAGVTSATSFSGSGANLTSLPSAQLTGALPSLDGSALTGVTGSGSGVVVQHDGSNVGTAGTINFSTNLDVTAIHAGIVTVTASGGGAASTAFVSAQTLSVAGVSTFNEDVQFKGANTNARWDHSTSDLILFDNTRLEFGSNKDFEIWHGGAHTYLKNSAGDLRIRGDKILLKRADDSERYLEANVNNEVKLFFNGNEKFATTNTGVTVTGTVSATSFSGIGSNITGISTSNIVGYGIGLGGGGGGSGISNVVDDTSPQLGGNLDVNGKDIVSVSDGDIEFDPNGNGRVIFKGNATHGSGELVLNCEQNSHGIILKGPPHSAAASYTLTLPNNIVNGQFLKTDGSGNLSWAASGTASRTTTSASTGSIAQAASANITIPTPGKTISLLKVAISAPAYVILYTDSTSRSNDASRSEGTDPTPGSGVLTEVSTTTSGASTFLMTPAVLGWNNDGTPANQIYAKVVNKRATSGSNTITVTLTSLALES